MVTKKGRQKLAISVSLSVFILIIVMFTIVMYFIAIYMYNSVDYLSEATDEFFNLPENL